MDHLRHTDFSQERAGGLRWLVPPGHAGLADLLARTVGEGDKKLLKESSARRIRAIGPSPLGFDLVLKEYRPRGLAARMRALVRSSPAAREFRILLRLHAAGVPVPQPVALGTPPFPRIWSRAFLALRAVPGAVTIEDILLERSPPPVRPALLAERLGRAIRTLHDAGVRQGDLHGGNILVSKEGDVFLIDFHGAALCTGPLSLPARFRDIVSLSSGFLIRGRSTDRHRFFKACCLGLPGLGDPRKAARELERDAWKNLNDVLRRYDRRPARKGKRFQEITVHNWRGMAERTGRASDLAGFLGPFPEETLRKNGIVIKDQPAGSVFALRRGDSAYVIKVYRRPGPAALPGRLLLGPKAKQAWINAFRLLHRGFDTARPVLYLAEPLLSPRGKSLVVFEEITGALDLDRFVRASDHRTIGRLIPRLARAVARMHDLHLANRDLKAQNILVTGEERIVFIDPDGISAVGEVDLYTMSRDLMRLNASFPPGKQVSLKDRLRFLNHYSRHRGLDRETTRTLRFETLHLTLIKWQKWRKKRR